MSDEPEIKVKKVSHYLIVSPEVYEGAQELHDALDALLTQATDPNYVPPKPWTGPPITPMPEAYSRLIAAADDHQLGLTLDILELHGPKPARINHDGTVTDWRCEGCEADGYEWEYPDWPCETTAVIARHLEVEVTG